MDVVNDISPGKIPDQINVFIEIPAGSRNKYEYDKKLKIIKLDRFLYSPVHYPGDYGFVPQTLWDDGDPLDVVVITPDPVYPGTLIEARPIGAMEMIDKGENDIKIIAVNINNPHYDKVKDVKDLPPHILKEIKHFFSVYKELEGAKVEVHNILGKTEAKMAIVKAVKLYKENNSKK